MNTRKYHSLTQWGLLMLAWLSVCAVTAGAEPEAAPSLSSRTPKRFLLVVETSSAMKRSSANAATVVRDLLTSRVRGQADKGDTLGVWTYNERLYTGRLPLQQWSPQTHQALVSNTVSFVRAQKFEKQPVFAQVLPVLNQLVADSKILIVIIVGSGAGTIQGTPFDSEIEKTFAAWREQQERKRMPLVTVLTAWGGKLTRFSVTPGQWPVEVPPLPVKREVAAAPPPPKSTPPVAKAAPLIISGKKTRRAEAAPITNALPGSQSSASANVPVVAPSSGAPVAPAATAVAFEPAPIPRPVTIDPQPAAGSAQVSTPAVAATNPVAAAVISTSPAVAVQPKAAESGPPIARAGETPAPSARAPMQTGDPAPPVAAAVPPASARGYYWVGGGALLLAAAAAGWFWLWRRRAGTAHTSLITNSIDHEPKH